MKKKRVGLIYHEDYYYIFLKQLRTPAHSINAYVGYGPSLKVLNGEGGIAHAYYRRGTKSVVGDNPRKRYYLFDKKVIPHD